MHARPRLPVLGTALLLGLATATAAHADDAPLRLADLTVVEHPPFEIPEGPGATCIVHVRLGTDGATRAANASDCPEADRIAAEEGLRRWTWAPLDPPAEVDLTLRVTFGPDGPPVVEADGPAHVQSTAPPPTPTSNGARRTLGVDRGPVAAAEHADGIYITVRVAPDVPLSARAYGSGAVLTCEATVTLKKSGKPEAITLGACPPELHDTALAALKKWRWSRATPTTPSMAGYVTTVSLAYRVP